MVEHKMCNMIEQMIDNDMNLMISSMPLKVRSISSFTRLRLPIVRIVSVRYNKLIYPYRRSVWMTMLLMFSLQRSNLHQEEDREDRNCHRPITPLFSISCRIWDSRWFFMVSIWIIPCSFCIQRLYLQELIMDYALTADPFISYGSIAMAAKGEISWRGQGGTPFNPPTIKLPPPHGQFLYVTC